MPLQLIPKARAFDRGRLASWLGILAVALLLSDTTAYAQLPKMAQRVELSAEIDVTKHLVRGSARIEFRNTSSKPLTQLLFHLYLNAFRDRDSVFMRESHGQLRGDKSTGPGFIDLETLTVDGHDVLTGAARELQPKDFTQLRAILPMPLSPDGVVTIETRFVSHLPPAFARTGYADDFHMIAQWFPKLAKLEPEGTFASFPYHALSEFYADFADYRLEVNTQTDVVVGATGTLIREHKIGDRIVRTFDAPAVHDVAIVASTKLETKRTRIGKVDLIALYPPGYELALIEHERTLARGLAHYGERFGPYPYPTLTMVIPPRGADGAAGMEYPMLFVTEGSWLGIPSMPGLSGVFVTAHELAHQWFQGLLASNEERIPVLDEGLAEWASIDLLRSVWGERASIANGFPISRFEAERLAATQLTAPTVAANWPASFYTDGEYGRLIYLRTAIALESLRRSHGRERFDRALTLYARRNQFRHPTPADLRQAFAEVYGQAFVDKTFSPLVFEGKGCEVHLASVRSTREGADHVTQVRARRTGEVALPTWIAGYSEDGKELARARFPAALARIDVSLRTKQPIALVVIDPDRALLVDPNTRDQVRNLLPPSGSEWPMRLTPWIQALLSSVGP